MNAIINTLVSHLPDLINLVILIIVCVLFTRINDLKESIDTRFNDINNRFNDINNRFSDINSRLDDQNQRINTLIQKTDTLSAQVHRIEGHLNLPRTGTDG